MARWPALKSNLHWKSHFGIAQRFYYPPSSRNASVEWMLVAMQQAVAIKKGQLREKAPMPSPMEMGTLRCDGCGEQFVIYHDSGFVDKKAAERQAHWLEKVLAEEHERESKHPDRIELPE